MPISPSFKMGRRETDDSCIYGIIVSIKRVNLQTHSHNNSDKVFITVLADGKFHQTVQEGTEGSVVRKYEDKEGVEKEKIELVHDSVSGLLTNIAFENGDFGTSLHVTLDDDGIIAMSTASSFGEDFMKKLPNIDLKKEIKLAPYAFEAEDGKNRKGITVYQDNVKIESFYFDKDKKKGINGIPEADGDTTKFKSDDWKLHFLVVRKFLVAETTKLALANFFEPTNENEAETDGI